MIEAWTRWEGHVVNGNFRLQKYLGGSSRSGVFLAQGRGLAVKPAAIKLIPANSPESSLCLSRWNRAASLSHPHLIKLMDQGRCRLGNDEMLFVAMEYAEENLAEILPQRALTPAEARDLLEPTLDVLSYLHDRGLVHGHLKPANVLAAGDQLKLASDSLCTPGEATPTTAVPNAYDPPEKATRAPSPAADVWSLGMTLAEALTQKVPAWTEKEETDPVVPASVPKPFFEIVRGCLRRDPQRRLTIDEIASYLRLPPSPPQTLAQRQLVNQAARTQKQSLVPPMIIATVAVVVLFGGLGLLRRPSEDKPRAAARPSAKSDAKPAGPAATVQPVSQSIGNTKAASSSKPSPVPGRCEATPANQTRLAESLGTAIDHTGQAGDVLREVLPPVPQSALDTIQGTIRVGVKVQVDSSGTVVGADLDTPGPSRYFARMATQAALGWRFSPSTQAAGREFIVRFDFSNADIRASATRAP